MKILAIDTSNIPLSVAVLEDRALLATITTNIKKNHSITLMPAISDVMKLAGVKPAELDRIVVAQGPGSFTGLRIGVATAKTLAFTLDCELVGVSSLAMLAAGISTNGESDIVPLFDARRNYVFSGLYKNDTELVNELPDQHRELVTWMNELKERNRPQIFVGTDVDLFKEQIIDILGDQAQFPASFLNIPQAFVLGLIGKDKEPVDQETFIPNYLRLTQAETQWLETHSDKDHNTYVEKI
ncbi:tRNA (adenosine(37)-N6)-threonylcarbamoyltransferase complex dimerization subunit type 1 TsaB [Dellaglioa sp. P0083]|uniref:tRNA (adenosine(37)-N6)-threonylcarbamoyltransferase complex dimerization subunit type 1 TsaB n=1 Tax=Dellaglioa kimchii TaxID=3344667 RepID=UPI0038D4D099